MNHSKNRSTPAPVPPSAPDQTTEAAAPPAPFVTIREARRLLGDISHSKIYQLIRARKLDLYKVGDRISRLKREQVVRLPRKAG